MIESVFLVTLFLCLVVSLVLLVLLTSMFCKGLINGRRDRENNVARRNKSRRNNRFKNLFDGLRPNRNLRHDLQQQNNLPQQQNNLPQASGPSTVDVEAIAVIDQAGSSTFNAPTIHIEREMSNSDITAPDSDITAQDSEMAVEVHINSTDVTNANTVPSLSLHQDVESTDDISEFENLSQLNRSYRSLSITHAGPLNLFDCDRVVPQYNHDTTDQNFARPLFHTKELSLSQNDINKNILSAKALQEKSVAEMGLRGRLSQLATDDETVFQSNASIVSSLLSQNISADGSYSNLSVLPPYSALPPPTYFEAVLNEHLDKQKDIIARRKKLITFNDL